MTEGKVDVPMNVDLWAQMHSGPSQTTDGAQRVLSTRALDELRAHHKYTVVEVDYVARSPGFQESVRTCYLSTVDGYRRKRSLPASVRITFPLPASREGGFWSRGK